MATPFTHSERLSESSPGEVCQQRRSIEVLVHPAWATIFAAVAGSVTLILFYMAVKTEWPSNYVSVETDFGVVINRSFARYFLFTIAPTYLVSLVACTLSARSHGHPLVVAIVIATTHICWNNGRHAIEVLRHRHDQARYALLLVDAFNIVVVAAGALAGSQGPGPYPDIVPSAAAFFSSLWTTTFVAIVGVCLLYVTRSRTDVTTLLRRSAKETSRYRDLALKLAKEHHADQALVLAILYSENLQRPAWIRGLERLKGKIWKPGSYGVMQVTSDHPLSDEESLRLALSGRLKDVRVPLGTYGSYDYQGLRDILASYNDNPEFLSLATQLYSLLYNDYKEAQPAPAVHPMVANSPPAWPSLIERPSTAGAAEGETDLRTQLGGQLAHALAMTVPDDEAIARTAATAPVEHLERLITALASLGATPSEHDRRIMDRVRQILDSSGS